MQDSEAGVCLMYKDQQWARVAGAEKQGWQSSERREQTSFKGLQPPPWRGNYYRVFRKVVTLVSWYFYWITWAAVQRLLADDLSQQRKLEKTGIHSRWRMRQKDWMCFRHSERRAIVRCCIGWWVWEKGKSRCLWGFRLWRFEEWSPLQVRWERLQVEGWSF